METYSNKGMIMLKAKGLYGLPGLATASLSARRGMGHAGYMFRAYPLQA